MNNIKYELNDDSELDEISKNPTLKEVLKLRTPISFETPELDKRIRNLCKEDIARRKKTDPVFRLRHWLFRLKKWLLTLSK